MALPPESLVTTFREMGTVKGFASASPVAAVAGERKRIEAGVAWTETPCCGVPFTEKRYWTTPSSGSDEMTIAHTAVMFVEAAVLVKLTVPCGGTVKLERRCRAIAKIESQRVTVIVKNICC